MRKTLVGAVLAMGMSGMGCTAQRQALTMVEPSYSFMDEADADATALLNPLYESASVSGAMAEVPTEPSRQR